MRLLSRLEIPVIVVTSVLFAASCGGELSTGGGPPLTGVAQVFAELQNQFSAECGACHQSAASYMGANADSEATRTTILGYVSDAANSPVVIPGDGASSYLITYGQGTHNGSSPMSLGLKASLSAWIDLEEGEPAGGVPTPDPGATVNTALMAMEWFSDCMEYPRFLDVDPNDNETIGVDSLQQNQAFGGGNFCSGCHDVGNNFIVKLELNGQADEQAMFSEWATRVYLQKYVVGTPEDSGNGYTVRMLDFIVDNGRETYNDHPSYDLTSDSLGALSDYFNVTKQRFDAAVAADTPCVRDPNAALAFDHYDN